ncbi:MAG: transporter substrate-binding domain-containing protein [Bradyrhizobium sp.]
MRRILVALLLMAGALAWRGAGPAVAAEPEPRAVLAPSGVLKAALYTGTPTSILPDPKSGGPRGVGYDLGKELAKRLGVPYEPVVFAKNADVLAAIKSGAADVAFTNSSSASRAKDMDFGPAFMDVELGYLVPKGAALANVADVDTAGLRVGVTAGSSSDATLSRDFKHAEVVRVTNFDAGIEMLSAGKLDAYATNKASLFEMSEKVAGSKVLDGRWGVEHFAVAIPKGRDQAMPFLRQFTNEVKSEGLVNAAITRAGLRGAVTSAAE